MSQVDVHDDDNVTMTNQTLARAHVDTLRKLQRRPAIVLSVRQPAIRNVPGASGSQSAKPGSRRRRHARDRRPGPISVGVVGAGAERLGADTGICYGDAAAYSKIDDVRLDGWNYIPRGYGMSVDDSGAPLWLRFWGRVPVLDRFAYPILVARGYFRLTPFPGWREEDRDSVPPGWYIEDRPGRGARSVLTIESAQRRRRANHRRE